MSEEPTQGRRAGDRSTWTESVHAKLDHLKAASEENAKATLVLAGRMNMFFLVPLAICAMGLATWALFHGKISEHSWLLVTLGCLAQFFGEGVKKIIEGVIPWQSKKVTEVKGAVTLIGLIVGVSLVLVGCVMG